MEDYSRQFLGWLWRVINIAPEEFEPKDLPETMLSLQQMALGLEKFKNSTKLTRKSKRDAYWLHRAMLIGFVVGWGLNDRDRLDEKIQRVLEETLIQLYCRLFYEQGCSSTVSMEYAQEVRELAREFDPESVFYLLIGPDGVTERECPKGGEKELIAWMRQQLLEREDKSTLSESQEDIVRGLLGG